MNRQLKGAEGFLDTSGFLTQNTKALQVKFTAILTILDIRISTMSFVDG